MSFVASIGYANCDIFFLGIPRLPREGEEIYASEFDVKPGGGIPATMINLARLGVPSQLYTFLGRDQFSRIVETELKKSGVFYQNLYSGEGIPTIVSATMVTKHERSFVSYRENVALTEEQQEQIIQSYSGAKIMEIHVGWLDLYKKLRKKNPQLIFVLDTGWSDDLSLEGYREYLELADYYTPNRKEALKITGKNTPEEALRVLGRYFRYPIVKLDSEGCLVRKEGRSFLVPPQPGIQQVDATGAGDAFLAGLLYGLYHDCDILESVLLGNITGGVCVQEIGCLTASIDEKRLLQMAADLKEGISEILK